MTFSVISNLKSVRKPRQIEDVVEGGDRRGDAPDPALEADRDVDELEEKAERR